MTGPGLADGPWSLGVSEEHRDLAESVAGAVARLAPREEVRARLGAVGRPAWWPRLVGQGLHAVHLPEGVGGGGGDLLTLAVVVAATGRGLLPGPLLPTVLASAAAVRGGATERRLAAFAAGATGAAALPDDGTADTALTARPDGDGLIVDGLADDVPGAAEADLLLLGAGGRWLLVPSDASGLTVTSVEGLDQTRGLGRVRLDGVRVPAEDVLGGLDADAVRTLAAVLFSAEAAGIARWCTETAVAHVKVREQFGRPVGAFQAVKHKCAHLHVQAETIAASAWDAARCTGEEQELAAAAAVAVCLPGVVDQALDAVTTVGGIGFTWEHDLTLYWRRAVMLRQLFAPVGSWERAVGERALGARRGFDIQIDDEPPGLRERLATELAAVAALPQEERRARLADLGYVAPQLPAPYGLGADATVQVVLGQEMARAGVTAPDIAFGNYALPTLMAHGTPEQRERFVLPTLRGEIVWCQLFSEPDAGSDLASLRTRAVRADDGWRLTGQKVWNSSAHVADWGICLARTNPDVPKHRGISYFLVDMHAPGVTVRPLRQATGAADFNEVFLDDVTVPEDCLVGPVDGGWQVARTTLGNERLSVAAGAGLRALTALLGVAERLPDRDDPEVRRALGRLAAEGYAVAALGLRGVFRQLSGLEPGAASSVLKVASGGYTRRARTAALDWVGPAAAGPAGIGTPEEVEQARMGGGSTPAQVTFRYLNTPGVLLGGGTQEIQLNIIGEHLLGLPRS